MLENLPMLEDSMPILEDSCHKVRQGPIGYSSSLYGPFDLGPIGNAVTFQMASFHAVYLSRYTGHNAHYIRSLRKACIAYMLLYKPMCLELPAPLCIPQTFKCL